MLSAASRRLAAAGFTLVELLVTITVLAVLMGVAAPSFNSQIANYRTRTGAEGIVNGLQLARTEAIRRNTNVSFTLNAGTGWKVAVVSPASTIQVRPAGESGTNLQISSLNDQPSLSFTSMGTVSGYSVTANLSRVTVAPPASVTHGDTYQIDVFAGGQIRMCNAAITAAGDPRKC